MAYREAPQKQFNSEVIQFRDMKAIYSGSLGAQQVLSGALFVSGGALHYVSSDGTTTIVGAA